VGEPEAVREVDAESVLVAVAVLEGESVLVQELEVVPVVELEGLHVREDKEVPDPELVLVAADVAEVEGALVDVADNAGEDVEESVADGELVPVANIEPEPLREDELVPDCADELVPVLELEAVRNEELVLV